VIIVTGSEGFIGKNLVSRLNDVVCLDADNRYDYLRLDPEDITHVYHMGAISDTTCDDLNLLHEHNVIYSIELFEWCIEHQIPVSYASSASIYGNGSGPLNYYAISKLTVDTWVQDHIYDFKSVHGYRFFNVYGPFQRPDHAYAAVIPKWIWLAMNGGVIEVYGDGNQTRDFTFIDNVTAVAVKSLSKVSSNAEPINLAYGNSVSLNQILNKLRSIFPLLRVEYLSLRDGDVRHSQNNPKKLFQYFSEPESVDFDQGFDLTYQWLKSAYSK